jgi:hypothetical protein
VDDSGLRWVAISLVLILGGLLLVAGYTIVNTEATIGQPYCDKLIGSENVSYVGYFGAVALINASQHFCEYNRTFNNYTYNRTAFVEALGDTR